ncbi:sensor domain-containing diguanylate cyclase [Brevibacillus marinus]|uniref:sensor domain-containing diguanylate cyclase n=1 Tax=Brevibacillus marinus TaxID=2496837 RepID=UPI000F846A11|nr:sensor domain-containing diguanylate cyclase [Brevibacillus marinus]
MCSESPKQVDHYRHMISEYYALLQRIETIQLPTLNSLSHQLLHDPALTDEEKILHLKFISEIGRISEKIQQLHWLSEHLFVLHALGQTFTKTFDTLEICKKAFELVSQVMAADAFFIAIYDEEEQLIKIPFSIDNGVIYEETTLVCGEEHISKVIATRETIHIKSSEEMGVPAIRWGNPERETRTCIFVPILLGDQVKGVISAQSYQEYAYRQEHEELLKIIGFQVASAIETASLYEKLYRSSVYDEMTGIKNYRAFHQDLDKLIAEVGAGGSVTLIMLDSDNLKQVNDLYGHHNGDLLIQKVAQALKHVLDEEEAYRYAGDEFMILAPGLSLTGAEQKVRRIQGYLAAHPLVIDGLEIPITVSTGIAAYPEHAATADELKRVVDKALYHSKKQGKNCITIFHHMP